MKFILGKKHYSNILASVLIAVTGIILVINPLNITLLLCRAAGFLLLMSGVFATGSYFLNISEVYGKSSLITGLIQLFLGAWITFKPELTVQFITVIFGFILLVHGFGLFQAAFDFRYMGFRKWAVMLIPALITIVLGIIVMVSPFGTISAAVTICGIFLIIDGVTSAVLSIVVSRAIKKLKKDSAVTVIDVEDV